MASQTIEFGSGLFCVVIGAVLIGHQESSHYHHYHRNYYTPSIGEGIWCGVWVSFDSFILFTSVKFISSLTLQKIINMNRKNNVKTASEFRRSKIKVFSSINAKNFKILIIFIQEIMFITFSEK